MKVQEGRNEPSVFGELTDMSTEPQIIHVTANALKALGEGPDTEAEGTDMARIGVAGRKDGEFQYDFEQVDPEDLKEGDIEVDCGSVTVYVDGESIDYIRGATIDYVEDEHGRGGFHVENPNPIWNSELMLRIQQLMDSDINPALASHGGAVELIDVQGENAFVRMLGGCQGCSSSAATLKGGIQALITEEVPEINAVIDTTDHAEGQNPYYTG